MNKGNNPDADGQFDKAPYFKFNDGKVKFNTNWFDNANDNYGSASAFLPKSFLIGDKLQQQERLQKAKFSPT